MMNIHLKFVDDLTVCESIDLKKQLVSRPNMPRPLEYHARTEHYLPKSESQIIPLLEENKQYTFSHIMKINSDKSKCMIFNTARKFDFKPELYFNRDEVIKLVESTKLLGVEIQSNLKWENNTDYICSRAYSRIWMIRRLKAHGASVDELADVYIKQVRCVLELAASVWSPGITGGQVTQIERVQKTVCAVILGDNYSDYPTALATLNLKMLVDRRKDLCLRFAQSEKIQRLVC